MRNISLHCTLLIGLSLTLALTLLVAASVSHATTSGGALAAAALKRTDAQVTYNGAYRALAYPGGDVPATQGVCTDVVIRSYRALGIDLQPLVHEDMRDNFASYPQHWGLTRPDRNIDHRRVPNLETYFRRVAENTALATNMSAQSFAPSSDAERFAPGDIVSWRLDGGLPHIGIVIGARVPNTQRHYVVHNIGQGPEAADVLFAWRITGHFRFLPHTQSEGPNP